MYREFRIFDLPYIYFSENGHSHINGSQNFIKIYFSIFGVRPFSSMLLKHTVKPCFFYSIVGIKEERKKKMFYLTTHSRHFVYGYMVSDMLKDHSYSRRENWLPLLHGLFFLISSKGSFICIILQQDSTYHCLCYTSHGALTQ